MNPRKAFARGGFAAAACVACCAPPVIAALGVTAGLAAVAGIFVGLAASITVALAGGTWIAARTRRPKPQRPTEYASGPVPVATPTRRERP